MPPDLLGDLQTLVDAELGRIGATAHRGVLTHTVGLITVAAVMLGVLLIAIGVFLHLLATHGPILAGLWVGGGLIVLAALAGAVAMAVAGQRAKKQARARAAMARSLVSSDLSQLLAAIKGEDRGLMVMAGAALLAGIVTGRQGR
ncbi:MAG: hypothetical protein GVY13_15470 [Alphaproteobacteria bacterium]|jgi:hypothetical protein|nr:hypothetical protein [Alphaproteobacteria bacterium]